MLCRKLAVTTSAGCQKLPDSSRSTGFSVRVERLKNSRFYQIVNFHRKNTVRAFSEVRFAPCDSADPRSCPALIYRQDSDGPALLEGKRKSVRLGSRHGWLTMSLLLSCPYSPNMAPGLFLPWSTSHGKKLPLLNDLIVLR